MGDEHYCTGSWRRDVLCVSISEMLSYITAHALIRTQLRHYLAFHGHSALRRWRSNVRRMAC